MNGPSLHLSWAELACRDAARTPYPAPWRTSRAVALAREFEAIRGIVGRPIAVLSGYRTPAHNRAVGGARASQHVEGLALDLRPPAGMSVDQLAGVVLARARDPQSAIRGVGVYPTFVHLDIRPRERLVRWGGSRPLADVA